MELHLGPILGFRGCTANEWKVSLIYVCNDGATLQIEAGFAGGQAIHVSSATVLKVYKTKSVRVVELTAARSSTARLVNYTIAGGSFSFTVPAADSDPRIAYTSCNGFSSPSALKKIDHKNERWSQMANEHNRLPFNLLLMGGDQVYADAIWENIKGLKAWAEKRTEARIAFSYSGSLDAKVEEFYFNLYLERWKQPEVARMLASVPSIMMWDDHDIFDGWGSYSDEIQACAVYQGIFKRAKEAFSIFQQRLLPDSQKPPYYFQGQDAFTMGFTFNAISLAVLDLRSERSEKDILSSKSWDAFYNWLNQQPSTSQHLVLALSIPVVYPDFDLLGKLLGFIPGRQELEDDLQDHWHARTHKEERLRLIHRLLKFAAERSCRITIVSGDVHVAAVGIIESQRNPNAPRNSGIVNQLISSAIVHPPPPGIAMYFLKQISDNVEEVDRGISAQLLQFPGLATRFISKRNYLALTLDNKARIWAEWHVEGEATPITKVINPCTS